eukprot:7120047-Alexandrium_andersonii.AAC.1
MQAACERAYAPEIRRGRVRPRANVGSRAGLMPAALERSYIVEADPPAQRLEGGEVLSLIHI